MFGMRSEDPSIPEVKANELETAFRKANFRYHLIAKEKKPDARYTLVSPSGEIDQQYLLTFQKSDKPNRAIFAAGWPKDAEENLKRLESCGFELDCGDIVCSCCNKRGHMFK